MQSSPPSESDERSVLRQLEDTDDEWSWSASDRGEWKMVTDEYQQFYEHWRSSSPGSSFPKKYPYELSLGVDKDGRSLLHFRDVGASESGILVTKSYEDIYQRILRLREETFLHGVVLTGQPGTGKTTFLKFMLARLISNGQVVLLFDNARAHLFYRGQVHYRVMTDVIDGLPRLTRPGRKSPIWTLVDADIYPLGPPVGGNRDIWPIHATSPKRDRWKVWRKMNDAALWGMPKWSMEELIRGLCLRADYGSFRSLLKQHLLSLDGPTPATTGNRAVDFALGVLRKERETKAEKESQGDMGNELGAHDVDMADEPGQPQGLDKAVDNAFEILLRNATEEIGFAPP
ncbi:hypothetical protein BJ322DRAFT_344792 [Thelephora terrestris]|uniref:Uncharacterized protein n=1 Tax=Thelephora terrestris TaxID=56493 RepID=A0A9P6H5T0_9AGAM|nr:hypothetical protein BJ322DRAFT_344792 [Thelephora terrestris]